jgi:hypothetical protein
MATWKLRDETAAGRVVDSFELDALPETLTLRELIRLRVRGEVERFNLDGGRQFRGLVRPDDAEVELNGYRLRTARLIDWERQADIAVAAFERNGFFVLVGGRQIEELDEVLMLSGDQEVSFVKLMALVGG